MGVCCAGPFFFVDMVTAVEPQNTAHAPLLLNVLSITRIVAYCSESAADAMYSGFGFVCRFFSVLVFSFWFCYYFGFWIFVLDFGVCVCVCVCIGAGVGVNGGKSCCGCSCISTFAYEVRKRKKQRRKIK